MYENNRKCLIFNCIFEQNCLGHVINGILFCEITSDSVTLYSAKLAFKYH